MSHTKLTSILLICTLLAPTSTLAGEKCLRAPLITKTKDINLEKELFSLRRLYHATGNIRVVVLMLIEKYISTNILPKNITGQANETLKFFYSHPVSREYKQEKEKIEKALREGKLDKQMISALQKRRSTKEQIELVKAEIELTIQIRDRVKNLLESCIDNKETDWYKTLQNTNSLITFRLGAYDPQKGFMQRKSYPVQLRKLEDDGYHIFDYLYNYFKDHISNLSFTTTDDCPMVMSTEDTILEIIDNLILNSVQAKANTVTLTCKPDQDPTKVAIIVEDNGRGIPKKDRNRIFEPYFSTKGESRGIGLAIVKDIVEKHGETIGPDNVDSLTQEEYDELGLGSILEANRGYLDELVQAIGANPSLSEFAQGTHEEIAGYYKKDIVPIKGFLKKPVSTEVFLNEICPAMSELLEKTQKYYHWITSEYGEESIEKTVLRFIVCEIKNRLLTFGRFKTDYEQNDLNKQKVIELIDKLAEDPCELTKKCIREIDGAIETYRRVAFGERLSVGTTFTIRLPAERKEAVDSFHSPIGDTFKSSNKLRRSP